MAMCEDFPCCGHEYGCCPDFDESGRQLNMKCVCGATVDINSRSSLCEGCLRDPDDQTLRDDDYDPDEDEWDEEYPDDDEEWANDPRNC